MFDPKSSYALNKRDKDAIVYPRAGEPPIRLTRADFETEKDFQTWKAWSDANYHAEEKADHIYANHTVPLDAAENEMDAVPSPEIVIEQRIEAQEQARYSAETVIRIRGKLTDKQYRRLWMYCVEDMTEQEIAAAEAVGQQRISSSIASAVKRVKKFFAPEGQK